MQTGKCSIIYLSESEVTQSCQTLCNLMDHSLPGSSMGFSRQEHWSGLPFASPGDLPDSGIEPGSPALQADALTSEPLGKPIIYLGLQKSQFQNLKSRIISQLRLSVLWEVEYDS